MLAHLLFRYLDSYCRDMHNPTELEGVAPDLRRPALPLCLALWALAFRLHPVDALPLHLPAHSLHSRDVGFLPYLFPRPPGLLVHTSPRMAAHPRIAPPHHQHVTGPSEHTRVREGPKWPSDGECGYRLLWAQGQHLDVDVRGEHAHDGFNGGGHHVA
jgi:hypothetical protein